MKKVTLLFLFAFVFEICFGQNFDFPTDSAKWIYLTDFYEPFVSSYQTEYTTGQSKIINSINYNKMYQQNTHPFPSPKEFIGSFRVDSNKVFL